MNYRQLVALASLLKRAKPPPILYRYRRPNQFTLDEVSKFQLFAASPESLNDPFESRATLSINRAKLKDRFISHCVSLGIRDAISASLEFEKLADSHIGPALERLVDNHRKDSGVICFSAIPNSIRMWSYYAQSHEGVCIGYHTKESPFDLATAVRYEDPQEPLDLMDEKLKVDPAVLADHVSLRKGSEWAFENEYRVIFGPIGLYPRLLPYSPDSIAEVWLGVRINADFRSQIIKALSKLPNPPKLVQSCCNFEKFELSGTILPLL